VATLRKVTVPEALRHELRKDSAGFASGARWWSWSDLSENTPDSENRIFNHWRTVQIAVPADTMVCYNIIGCSIAGGTKLAKINERHRVCFESCVGAPLLDGCTW